ncbi:hypothetical protein [Novosphingobium sp.]|uniref:hypothetical protein n=1 Tax=Novosphingobium sp. TaxID=1874826 RepID=UPI00286E8C45|nr:hypothetical protein [Novosphingobium sp.]
MVETAQHRVKALIERLAPDPICSHCIVERLGLDEIETSERFANELVGVKGFERQIGSCAICGESKKAIRFRNQ